MKSHFVALAAATLVGSMRIVTAGDLNQVNPQVAPADVCVDAFGNQRFVAAGEPCKANEQLTKIIPQKTPDPDDDPQAQLQKQFTDLQTLLQKQVADLSAKVSALQAQVDQSKNDQSKSDKEYPESTGLHDAKTGKPTKSPIRDRDDLGDPSLPDNQIHMMPGQKVPGQKNQSNGSGGAGMQRVVAPFEVVDSHGNVILRVSEDAQVPKGARVTIGPSDGNKYGVRIFNAGGQLVAGVGHGADGGGLVVVSDGVNPVASMSATGRAISVFKGSLEAVSMKVSDDGGEMTIYNNGTPVGHMSVTGLGGGALVIARPDGFGVFEAQAEPNTGGTACVNRISAAGKAGRWCLGTALPLR